MVFTILLISDHKSEMTYFLSKEKKNFFHIRFHRRNDYFSFSTSTPCSNENFCQLENIVSETNNAFNKIATSATMMYIEIYVVFTKWLAVPKSFIFLSFFQRILLPFILYLVLGECVCTCLPSLCTPTQYITDLMRSQVGLIWRTITTSKEAQEKSPTTSQRIDTLQPKGIF